MDLQNQLTGDWSSYFSNQPPVGFDASANRHLLCSELRGSSVRLEDNSDPYCSIWKDAERARVKSCNSRSFAMDARIRLNNLKSGCNSLLPCCATDGMLYNYNCQKDLWDREEPEEEESALDSVELLDVEDDVRDEESCVPHRLYESSKKQVFVERSESALRWCRHVLDNPSPEMEAACRSLINRLDQRSICQFYRAPAVFHHNIGSFTDKTSVSTTHNVSDRPDDSITTSYRLQNITDVHIMARLQEASLRQDYVSTPAGRSPESSPGQPSLSSSPRQSPTSAAKQGCQSPKLARLHQQVTQFKLLKLAQNQATSPGRTRSPMRTSLRSLQAVRNSRSLDTDDCQSADPVPYPPSAPMNHNRLLNSVRVSSDRTTAVLRSQSLSPSRIPHPAKGYLPVHGRVFASTDRSTSVAWGRNVPFTQR
ncbi:SLAIN motif-containing protein-like [Anarrhichthys ocellatus]|uniref:SLAIN motif-containing protein-like n=1 Tax=Anarrhichthys ocellatus TaxID=433405 RepID=UPI0012ED3044|nr:SLAIN motif-containing protein-like [Anarrhichthys ocellatus]